MPRAVTHRYRDPVDEIWLAAAARLGVRVERTRDAYASYDGAGTLSIADGADFDADDSLAQMILHELCHALVAGEGAMARRDWGLDNETDADVALEHACHRLQAALSSRHGLRDFFAVTTDHRAYWDALPDDPLAPGSDPAIELARAAWVRARQGEAWSVLDEALSATRAIAEAASAHAPPGSLWRTPAPRHEATGFPLHRDAARRCGDCAWAAPEKRGLACRQSACEGRRAVAVDRQATACERFEPRLDEAACRACGACCREGFHLVQVGAREPLRKHHPELVQRDEHGFHVPRPGDRCIALDGNSPDFSCRVYDLRPKSCREFAIGGDACLQARRRVGLSR